MYALIEQEINGAFKKINNLIMKTEEIYGSIFAKLPSIEEELELSLQEMEILLNYFIYRDESTSVAGNESEEGMQLAELLRNMQREFTDAVVKMFDETVIRKTLDRFLASVHNPQEPGIDDLMEIIKKIKRHIQDIEVVSINAMLHSSRLGDDGKAFGVISRNIKEFSNDMKAHYNTIFEYAEKLGRWKTEFTNEINKLLEFSENLRLRRLEDFHELFKRVFASLKTISNLLKEANHNLQSTMTPLQDLMAFVQKQDIIRQSLENVIKCLEGLQEGMNEDSEGELTEKLNYIVFEDQVVEMSIALIDNIALQLEESLAEIKETIAKIHHNLSETYEESYEVTEFLSGDRGNERNTVEEIFYQVILFIQQFKEELVHISNEVNTFSLSGDAFHKQMNGIEKQIVTIKNRVDFLRNLNVLSRIELSRLTSEMASFGDEIEQISRRVIDEVNLNETFIVTLKASLDDDLRRFFSMLHQNKEMIQKMITTSDEALKNLKMMEDLVIKAIRPANGTSELLIKEVTFVKEIIEDSHILRELMNAIRETLVAAQEKVRNEKEKIFAEAGVNEWENKNDRLIALFDKLTTYYERVVFNNLVEENLDVGSEAGELVLF